MLLKNAASGSAYVASSCAHVDLCADAGGARPRREGKEERAVDDSRRLPPRSRSRRSRRRGRRRASRARRGVVGSTLRADDAGATVGADDNRGRLLAEVLPSASRSATPVTRPSSSRSTSVTVVSIRTSAPASRPCRATSCRGRYAAASRLRRGPNRRSVFMSLPATFELDAVEERHAARLERLQRAPALEQGRAAAWMKCVENVSLGNVARSTTRTEWP